MSHPWQDLLTSAWAACRPSFWTEQRSPRSISAPDPPGNQRPELLWHPHRVPSVRQYCGVGRASAVGARRWSFSTGDAGLVAAPDGAGVAFGAFTAADEPTDGSMDVSSQVYNLYGDSSVGSNSTVLEDGAASSSVVGSGAGPYARSADASVVRLFGTNSGAMFSLTRPESEFLRIFPGQPNIAGTVDHLAAGVGNAE